MPELTANPTPVPMPMALVCEGRFENSCSQVFRDARPVVRHGNAERIFLCIEPARQTYLPVRGLLLQRLLRVDYQV